ncbi:hypothetical protein [Mycobacterium sp. 1081908.1]|uniref:hypothetical protein n=1 Tax=Mycobacterium sp. 1081908.1 TaxID=1834066 RepID=UPI0007FD8E95|nr:hypothetical protein [Mycobacterium sp. 1081908.1]OBK45868.1 hypothetical protein A5655_10430 [Mycobacterium sp. 1081908.1]
MPKLAVLTAPGGAVELAEFPLTAPAPGTVALKLRHTNFPFGRLMPKPFRPHDVNEAFAAADAGLVPRGALVP